MNIALVQTKAPFDDVYARETQDLILALAAVEHCVTIIYSGDAIYQLIKGDDSAILGVKDLRARQKLYSLYDIEALYVCEESLSARGFSQQDLTIEATVLTPLELRALLSAQHHILGA